MCVQRRAIKQEKAEENVTYKEWLRELWLVCKKRRLRGEISLISTSAWKKTSKESAGLFSQVTSNKMQANGLKLPRVGLDWTFGRIYLWRDWSSIETRCPGKWCTPHPRRYLSDVWSSTKGYSLVIVLSRSHRWLDFTILVFSNLDDSVFKPNIAKELSEK